MPPCLILECIYNQRVSGERLGGFEELVLLAVAGLAGDGYGVNIRDHLENGTAQRVSVGAVYATLERLERKRYVHSRLGGATNERGGKRKRLYRVTARGTTVMSDACALRNHFWHTIETVTSA